MGMTGGASDTALIIACPTCGELYDSPASVRAVLRNSGFCVNITCLRDLSHLPLEAALAPERGDRRDADRRAS
jgi:hypothetical protein